jgi:glycerol uptake facilitator-like aquaporin
MDKLDSYILFNELFGTMILSIGTSSCFKFDSDGNYVYSDRFVLISSLFTALIFMIKIGGCDYNPGVTLMKLLTYKEKEKLNFINRIIMPSIIMQCLGSTLGFLISFYFRNGFVMKLCIHKDTSQACALFIEVICTFFLFLMVLIIDYDIDKSNDVMKIVIVLAGVLTGIGLGGNISGAGMNPAIGFGANFVRFLVTGDLNELKYLWIYILGPMISSYLASRFFLEVYSPYKKQKKITIPISKDF